MATKKKIIPKKQIEKEPELVGDTVEIEKKRQTDSTKAKKVFNANKNYDTEPDKKTFNGFMRDYERLIGDYKESSVEKDRFGIEYAYYNLVRQYRLFLRPDNGKEMTHSEAVKKATVYVSGSLKTKNLKNIMEE